MHILYMERLTSFTRKMCIFHDFSMRCMRLDLKCRIRNFEWSSLNHSLQNFINTILNLHLYISTIGAFLDVARKLSNSLSS